MVAYGIRYIVENFLEQRWTLADVELASHFYRRGDGGAAWADLTGLTCVGTAARTLLASANTPSPTSSSRSSCARMTVHTRTRARAAPSSAEPCAQASFQCG